SLLPGLLAPTRTGLPPASDDELTNNKMSRYVTASPPVLLGARKAFSEERSLRNQRGPYMSDQLESRLGATLGHAATRPPQFSTEVASRSRRCRNALVAGVCLVAIAVPITVIATRGTGGRSDVAMVATEPSLGNPVWDTTPIGKRLTIDNFSEGV
ncbi:hypothetical protein, partial [Nonomuraea sp. KM90]|uniref:hypothetical protein n=1 Tax=Nonomuraea sp. KM90 TaxID=3457428 RepID=UPI003FCCC1B6